jgi:hypothetical protein
MRDAQRNVDAFIDQVDWPVKQIELCRYHRIFVHEGVEHRPQDIFAGDDGRGEGKRAARGRAFASGCDVGLLEIDQHAAAGGDIALAGLAQLERACRAMKQFGADMLLEESDRPAHGGRRPAKAPAGASEAALVDGRNKHLHRIDAIHLSSGEGNTGRWTVGPHPPAGKARRRSLPRGQPAGMAGQPLRIVKCEIGLVGRPKLRRGRWLFGAALRQREDFDAVRGHTDRMLELR